MLKKDQFRQCEEIPPASKQTTARIKKCQFIARNIGMFTGPVHRKLHHRLITEKSRDKLFAILQYFLRKSGKHTHSFLPDLPSRHIQQSFSMFSACKTFSTFNSIFKCNVSNSSMPQRKFRCLTDGI